MNVVFEFCWFKRKLEMRFFDYAIFKLRSDRPTDRPTYRLNQQTNENRPFDCWFVAHFHFTIVHHFRAVGIKRFNVCRWNSWFFFYFFVCVCFGMGVCESVYWHRFSVIDIHDIRSLQQFSAWKLLHRITSNRSKNERTPNIYPLNVLCTFK